MGESKKQRKDNPSLGSSPIPLSSISPLQTVSHNVTFVNHIL